MTENQGELFAQLRAHLHRGASWWYTWTSEGKRSSWAPVGKDAAKITGAKNLYFGVHATGKKKNAHERATLEDVAAINCLFAEYDAKDFDSKDAARAYMLARPLAPSVIVDSGGGYHAYWLLAEPFALDDKTQRERARTAQANWVAFVGGDPGAKDLARVLRVPGTLNQKEKYAPNFPAVRLIKADWTRLYTLDELEKVAANVATARKEAPKFSANGHGAYLDAAIRGERNALARALEGERNTQLNKSAFALGTLIHAGLDRAQIESDLLQIAASLGLSEREAARTIKSGLDKGEREPRTIPERERAKAAAVRAQALDVATNASGFNLTDFGNAERLIARHGKNFRYCYTWDKWLHWDGRRWSVDDNGEIVRAAKDTARAIATEADKLDDKTKRTLVEWSRRSEGHARINAMIELAKSEPGTGVTLDELDTDPWAINCANGTLDLRTGELRPHDRANLITKLAPAEYDANATSERWDDFLNTATQGNADLQTFLQRAAGYSLTGSTREEVLFFVHGPAAAGKSTFVEALKSALGDYAAQSDFETFLMRNMIGGARNDIARLVGARMVASIEVDEGKRLAEGLVKTLVGGDTIAARFLYQEAFEYIPQFKLWLVANHAPRVRDDDDAIWRRILRVPFERVIPKGERDPKVKEELRDPGKGGRAVLAWAVRGALAWQAFGLTIPAIIEDATNAYREDMDPLKEFFADVCILGPQYKVTPANLRTAYENWAKENGEKYTVSRKNFVARLNGIGVEKIRQGNAYAWRGIGLLSENAKSDN